MTTARLQTFPPLVGNGRMVRTLLGRSLPYLDADTAATTRPLEIVCQRVSEFLANYGSVHRGSGANSRWSTEVFMAARAEVLSFVDADPATMSICVTGNTTSAINKLRRKLAFDAALGDEVFLSEYEHSSNDLPWRGWNPTRVPADTDGLIDLAALEDLLKYRRGQGRMLVALAGASNLTGGLAPLGQVARITHRYGGLLFVDAAQLVGHRGVSMRGTGDGDHIDFMAFSGHKMYAPFGAGVLIGLTSVLAATAPDDVGGGTVDFVTQSQYDLTSDVFRRENPGTPNAAGLVAMAVAGRTLKQTIDFDQIEDHEDELLDAAGKYFLAIPGLAVLGELDYNAARKCAIASFVLEGHDHALVAARLSYEFGIGVRHGHLCQFPFVARLLGLSERDVAAVRGRVLSGEKSAMYGVVRASFGLSNTVDDVARIGDALEEIATTENRVDLYRRLPGGNWQPKDLPPDGAERFFDPDR